MSTPFPPPPTMVELHPYELNKWKCSRPCVLMARYLVKESAVDKRTARGYVRRELKLCFAHAATWADHHGMARPGEADYGPQSWGER